MSASRVLQSPALRRAAGRGFVTVLLIIAIIGALGAVALSPALIGRLNNATDVQWQRLSDIGQTYGAASAMLSVLALIGVAVSLILQSRETRAAREQARRALHFELLKMAMDDPFYLRVWGPFAPDDTDRYREHMYANLIVSHWQMDWDVGTLDEAHLREVAAVFFQGEIGYRFWGDIRGIRMKAEGASRTRRRFFRILDQEWLAAVVAEPAALVSTPVDVSQDLTTMKATHANRYRAVGAFVLGGMLGAGVAGAAVRSRLSSRSARHSRSARR